MTSPDSDNAAHRDTDGTAPTDVKAPATGIVLDRVEGPNELCGSVTVTGPDLWAAANRQLSRWALTAPRGGGYDKVDFTVTFANGSEYKGRYDLEFDGACDLAEHIRATATWFADPANTEGNPHIHPGAWQAVLDTLQLTD